MIPPPCGHPRARTWVNSIFYCNVCECCPFLVKIRIDNDASIWNKTTVSNLVIVRFIFTISLNMIGCCTMILHVVRGICVLVLYDCSTDGCVASASVVVFLPKFGHMLISIWNNGSKFGNDMIVH